MNIIRIIIGALFASALFITNPASADTECVNAEMFSAVQPGMTEAAVTGALGSAGTVIASTGHTERYWVGQKVYKVKVKRAHPKKHQKKFYYKKVVKNIYQTNYVFDRVRSYPRCGGGNVGVNFDTYTSNDARFKVYRVALTDFDNPRNLIWWQ